MILNQSQTMIIGALVTARLGIPNIEEVFTEEIIRFASINPSATMIFLISLLKIALVISSITIFVKLFENIQFTYERHSKTVFDRYILKLVLTFISTFIILEIINKFFFK